MSPRKPAVRVSRNMTLSPVTEARLEALTNLTGVPRGRIVDLALANLAACPDCHGRGTIRSELGPDTATCAACRGARLCPGGEQ